MPKLLFPAFLALSLSIPALCQTAQLTCAAGTSGFALQHEAARRTGVGTAYTLTSTIKSEKKLYDGNIISGFATASQARDSQGRARVDLPTMCGIGKDHQPLWDGSVSVTDPIAKTDTYWSVWEDGPPGRLKSATVSHVWSIATLNPPSEQDELRKWQTLSQSPSLTNVQASKHNIQFKVEELGKRDLVGLEATGLRLTTTAPAGLYGNALPVNTVEEKWISDDYRMILLDIIDDPVNGKTTYEVTSFTAGEPDASLFQPPAGYEVTDRTVNR